MEKVFLSDVLKTIKKAYVWNDEISQQILERAMMQLPPADDVPEIVRCKDCKHGSPNGRYGCTVYHYKRYETHDMKPDDFCSFAERRTDE